MFLPLTTKCNGCGVTAEIYVPGKMECDSKGNITHIDLLPCVDCDAHDLLTLYHVIQILNNLLCFTSNQIRVDEDFAAGLQEDDVTRLMLDRMFSFLRCTLMYEYVYMYNCHAGACLTLVMSSLNARLSQGGSYFVIAVNRA